MDEPPVKRYGLHIIDQSKKDLNLSGDLEMVGVFNRGENVILNDAEIDITGGVLIGNNVHFGHNVYVLSCSHPPELLTGLERRRNLRCKPIVIEDDVYIGSRATILPGAHIKKGSYIGAGSIVTENSEIGPNDLWAGNPARFIKKL